MPDILYAKEFAKAARRHFDDAAYLHTDDRLSTADHLYGFAAECAAKSLLLRFTEATMDPKEGEDKDSPKPWAKRPDDPGRIIEFGHVNELIREIRLLARGRAGAPLDAALRGDLQAFKKWHVKYRYSDGTYAELDVVDERRDAARRILALREQAWINGKLP